MPDETRRTFENGVLVATDRDAVLFDPLTNKSYRVLYDAKGNEQKRRPILSPLERPARLSAQLPGAMYQGYDEETKTELYAPGNQPTMGRFAARPNPFRDAPEPVATPQMDTSVSRFALPTGPDVASLTRRTVTPLDSLVANVPGVRLPVRGPAAPLDPLAGNPRLEAARNLPTTVLPTTVNDQEARFTRQGADSTLPLEPDLGNELTPPSGGKPILLNTFPDGTKQWFLGTDKNGSKVYTGNDPRNIVYGDKPVASEKRNTGAKINRPSPAQTQDQASLNDAFATQPLPPPAKAVMVPVSTPKPSASNPSSSPTQRFWDAVQEAITPTTLSGGLRVPPGSNLPTQQPSRGTASPLGRKPLTPQQQKLLWQQLGQEALHAAVATTSPLLANAIPAPFSDPIKQRIDAFVKPVTHPVEEGLNHVSNSVRNFTQGATAPGLDRFDRLVNNGQAPNPNDYLGLPYAGAMARSVFTDIPGNIASGGRAVWRNDGDMQIGKRVPGLAPNTLGGMLYNTGTALGSDPTNLLFAERNLALTTPRVVAQFQAMRQVAKAAEAAGEITKFEKLAEASLKAKQEVMAAERIAQANAKPSVASSIASSVRNAGAKAAGKISARLAPNAYRRAQTVYATDTNLFARRNGYNYTNPFRNRVSSLARREALANARANYTYASEAATGIQKFAGRRYIRATGAGLLHGRRWTIGLDRVGSEYLQEVGKAFKLWERFSTKRSTNIANIAESLKIPSHIVEDTYIHLNETQHTIPYGPLGETETGFFEPDLELATLFTDAANGNIGESEGRLRNLLAHEYVEIGLMKRNVPYVSNSPEFWTFNKEEGFWETKNFGGGAHMYSVTGIKERSRGQFKYLPENHYVSETLRNSVPDLAKDFSNVDEVIEALYQIYVSHHP